MNPNDHTEMYIDGYQAAIAGNSRGTNPYSLKKNRISWERGYNAGVKELSRRSAKHLREAAK